MEALTRCKSKEAPGILDDDDNRKNSKQQKWKKERVRPLPVPTWPQSPHRSSVQTNKIPKQHHSRKVSECVCAVLKKRSVWRLGKRN